MPPNDKLTPAQNSLLIVLMSAGGEASNTDLSAQYGISITGDNRRKLESGGYVEGWRVGNAYSFRLLDKGWATCRESLDVLNPKARTLSAALASLLAGVHRDLERTSRSLAMVFAPRTDVKAPGETAIPTASEVVEQIRAIYKELAPEQGAWVSLADIRGELAATPATAIDAALRKLEQLPDVSLVPQANEKALSSRTRQAAVVIGREARHFIAIGI